MAHTETLAIATLCWFVCIGCSAPEPKVVFDDAQVRVSGKTLELGVPVADWEDKLGPAEMIDRGNNAYWSEHRLLAHLSHNACDVWLVQTARVVLEKNPSLIPQTLNGSVRMDECVLSSDTELEGWRLDCGGWLGSNVLQRGRPFDFAYMLQTGGLFKTVSVTSAMTPSIVSYGVANDQMPPLGTEISPEQATDFVESGACDRPLPKLKFEGERDRELLRKLWHSVWSD